jgi:CheY-like chemotaxis protein
LAEAHHIGGITVKRWILVEDEPDLYNILCTIFDEISATVIAFTTGEDTLAWLNTLSMAEPPDNLPVFALIDIRLPEIMSGIELAWHLRQHPLLCRMPIVLMTAYHLTAEQEQVVLHRSGANLLLYTPLPSFAEMRRIFADLT